jgi:NADH-quinone oxidoreductase subunit M
VGEFLLIAGLYTYNPYLAAVAGLTIILGAVYMLRAFRMALLGSPRQATQVFPEITSHEKLILYPLVLLVFAIGIYPKPLLDITEPAIKHLLESIQTTSLTLR